LEGYNSLPAKLMQHDPEDNNKMYKMNKMSKMLQDEEDEHDEQDAARRKK
jgi:hypothetical protein